MLDRLRARLVLGRAVPVQHEGIVRMHPGRRAGLHLLAVFVR
jgi:hypothetical protein